MQTRLVKSRSEISHHPRQEAQFKGRVGFDLLDVSWANWSRRSFIAAMKSASSLVARPLSTMLLTTALKED